MTFVRCNVLFPGGQFFSFDNVGDVFHSVSDYLSVDIVNAKLEVLIDNEQCDFWFSSKETLFESLMGSLSDEM